MLNSRSKQVRLKTYFLSKANGGYHYGGSFSCMEILINLYDHILTADDKFILSKGHACWGLYHLLQERGLQPKLEGHPYLDVANGIHFTTGSEGHGFPAAVGMAFAKKKLHKKGRIFVLMGDGECQEGTTWESLLLGGFHNLDNLTVIVDFNFIQGSGWTNDILPVNNLEEVARSCGWDSVCVDGHNNEDILQALRLRSRRPIIIIAETIKGKGVDFMEDCPGWHSKWPNAEEEQLIIQQLS